MMNEHYENNTLQYLPYYDLNDHEFNINLGIWARELTHDIDMFDIIPNPDKFDESDPDLMLNSPVSNYFSMSKINSILNKTGRPNSLSMFHFNIRSLPKNLTLLNDFLYSLDNNPDILAVTETRLSENSVCNTDIMGYNFLHTDSPTSAGGAAFYISKHLSTIARPDIKFDMTLVESCWAEIDPGKGKKHIILGCIYRHPKANISQFTTELEEI